MYSKIGEISLEVVVNGLGLAEVDAQWGEREGLGLELVQECVGAVGEGLEEQTACADDAAGFVELDAEGEHGGGLFAFVVVEGQVVREVAVLHHGLAGEWGSAAFEDFCDADKARAVDKG